MLFEHSYIKYEINWAIYYNIYSLKTSLSMEPSKIISIRKADDFDTVYFRILEKLKST